MRKCRGILPFSKLLPFLYVVTNTPRSSYSTRDKEIRRRIHLDRGIRRKKGEKWRWRKDTRIGRPEKKQRSLSTRVTIQGVSMKMVAFLFLFLSKHIFSILISKPWDMNPFHSNDVVGNVLCIYLDYTDVAPFIYLRYFSFFVLFFFLQSYILQVWWLFCKYIQNW